MFPTSDIIFIIVIAVSEVTIKLIPRRTFWTKVSEIIFINIIFNNATEKDIIAGVLSIVLAPSCSIPDGLP